MFLLLCYFYFFSVISSVSADILPFLKSKRYQDGDWGNYPAQTFLSDREVIAPVANVLTEAQPGVSAAEYITWAPSGPDIPLTGPQLLDAQTLSVVYQAPAFGPDSFGIFVQTCNDTEYMIWWSGDNIAGRAAGTYHILNNKYEHLWNVTAIGLEYADAHDLFLTPQCTAVFTVNQPREYDLNEFGIEGGWIMESYIQEVDLLTNQLLFQWQATDHVDLHDSYWEPGIRGHLQRFQGTKQDDSWDYFHINSVEKDFRGNYMISARHTHSLYYIDGRTGEILWTLGGKRNDFFDLSDGEATNFAWQHHARWTSPNLTAISVFDDKNCRYVKAEDPVSRGIVLELDYMVRTVKATSYRATSEIQAFRKGSAQYLENGNVLLGYGNEPGFTEYAPNGTVLYDVRFGPTGLDRDSADNYRALKVDWTGNPTWNPKITAGPFLQDSYRLVHPGAPEALPALPNNTAYFSWNGGTKLARWVILASNNATRLVNKSQLWCELPKSGFETSFYIGDTARWIRAVAISADNEALAASPVLDMHTGMTIEQEWSPEEFDAPWQQDQNAVGVEDGSSRVQDDTVEDDTDEDDTNEDDQQSTKATTQQMLAAFMIGGIVAASIVAAIVGLRHRICCMKAWTRGYQDIGPGPGDEEDGVFDSTKASEMNGPDSTGHSVDGGQYRSDIPILQYPLYDGDERGILSLGVA